MREQARIRKFCNQLADLWESKSPDMRFGQMVVCLNKALGMPRHDIFYLEENEMLDVIRKFFSDDYDNGRKTRIKSDALHVRWQKLTESLRDEEDTFELSSFRKLLAETWQYFMDTVDDFGIDNKDLPLIGCMYIFANHSESPRGIIPWEYEACIKIVEALLCALQAPLLPQGYKGNFYDGYIVVEEYHSRVHSLHISELESYLQKLSHECYENHYIENYHEDGTPC